MIPHDPLQITCYYLIVVLIIGIKEWLKIEKQVDFATISTATFLELVLEFLVYMLFYPFWVTITFFVFLSNYRKHD